MNTLTTSNTVTVSGINSGAAISITGGEYRINAGTYTSIAGTVTNGQTVTVRLTSSAAYSTLTSATLTIGGVTGAFNVTTQAADNTPNPFSFATKTGVNPNTTQASEAIIISGITAGTAISVSAGSEYKLNNAPWTSVAGVLNNSDTVQVRHTSLTGSLTQTVTTLTIGTVSGTFTTINKDK